MTSETPPIEPYGGTVDFNCNGIAGCCVCGWRGVPTIIRSDVSVVCPCCHAGEDDLLHKPRTPRNAPCPCGSGTKYKKCCGR